MDKKKKKKVGIKVTGPRGGQYKIDPKTGKKEQIAKSNIKRFLEEKNLMEKDLLIKSILEVIESQETTKEEKVAQILESIEKSKKEEPAKQEEVEEAKAPKFAQGIFQEFSLGSTLVQTPYGTVLTNVKPSQMDYREAALKTANTSMTAEQLQELKDGKDS